MTKRGQVTVFVIISIVIVASIIGYVVFRNLNGGFGNDGEFSEVFSYYENCIEQYAKTGISVAGTQGGRLVLDSYQAGTDYAPFGNHLFVAGVSVPYWMTITSNGVIDENVPSQNQVENELNAYIESRLSECSLDSFRERGMQVSVSSPDVKTSIASDGVLVETNVILSASNENSSAQRSSFSVTVPSNFGNLLKQAQEIYLYEQDSLFLENYSFDVLRLYAPVDGVEIKCSPSVWNVQDVFSELQEGLESNLLSLKFDGNYYSSNTEKYFVVNKKVSGIDGAQVIYDSSWPSRFEVYGNEENLLVAKPVGSQAGLNALGFCYVPYHFVYDLMFPVLFRITSGEDIFQFPVVVVIDRNVPRNAIQSSFGADYEQSNDLCAASTNDLSVQVRDSDGAVSGAQVSYRCFDQSCTLGQTNPNGVVSGKVPACLNGHIEVSSERHSNLDSLFSSHNSSSAVLYVQKEYDVNVKLLVDGLESRSTAFISLIGDEGNKQAIIPEASSISIASGFYNLTVYQYGNTSIVIPSSTSQQCIEVSAGGLSGLFGATKEQCFTINNLQTTLQSALTAGGKGEIYLPESLLETGELVLSVSSLPKPTNIQTLQDNYALFETQGADVIYG